MASKYKSIELSDIEVGDYLEFLGDKREIVAIDTVGRSSVITVQWFDDDGNGKGATIHEAWAIGNKAAAYRERVPIEFPATAGQSTPIGETRLNISGTLRFPHGRKFKCVEIFDED